MKQIMKEFYAEISRKRYPDACSYIVIRATSLSKAKIIIEEFKDMIEKIHTKEPEKPWLPILIIRNKD